MWYKFHALCWSYVIFHKVQISKLKTKARCEKKTGRERKKKQLKLCTENIQKMSLVLAFVKHLNTSVRRNSDWDVILSDVH